MKVKSILFAALLLMLFILGCTSKSPKPAPTPKPPVDQSTQQPAPLPAPPENEVTIKLATTTSVDNSGLLKFILPDLYEKEKIKVDIIAVGTGKALEHGCAGDVDVVLVHAPDAEKKFIEDGCGTERFYVCQNEFVIVGPQSDPAGLKNVKSVVEAFKLLAKGKAKFISRGDNSGTHKAELDLWKKAGIEPKGDWYISAGQGMGAVLTMANESQAYTFTDTGTYYSMVDKLNLPVVFSGDNLLINIYSVIPLNKEKYPELKHNDVARFIRWLTSGPTKELIQSYQANGHFLFKVDPTPASY
jgi:tungstate transport system substrate-binding protein